MNVRDFLFLASGTCRIIDDASGKLLHVIDLSRTNDIGNITCLDNEVSYVSPNLRYFTNQKRAEYSAAINIYI